MLTEIFVDKNIYPGMSTCCHLSSQQQQQQSIWYLFQLTHVYIYKAHRWKQNLYTEHAKVILYENW